MPIVKAQKNVPEIEYARQFDIITEIYVQLEVSEQFKATKASEG